MTRILLYSPMLAAFLASSAAAQTAPAQQITVPPKVVGPAPAAATTQVQVTVPAAPAATTVVQGRVLRTGPDQFVVVDSSAKEYTFYTSPKTVYLQNEVAVPATSLAVGTNVSAVYTTDADRYFVSRVNVLPVVPAAAAPGAIVPSVPAVPVVPAVPAVPATRVQEVLPVQRTGTSATNFYAQDDANVYQGQVIRVGTNQVVVRTANGSEVIVNVNPQTTYRIQERAVTLTDLRPGTPVRINYEVRENQPYARTVVGVPVVTNP